MAIDTTTCRTPAGCKHPVQGTFDVIKAFANDTLLWHRHSESAFQKANSYGNAPMVSVIKNDLKP
jgi:hypothetical protein